MYDLKKASITGGACWHCKAHQKPLWCQW